MQREGRGQLQRVLQGLREWGDWELQGLSCRWALLRWDNWGAGVLVLQGERL